MTNNQKQGGSNAGSGKLSRGRAGFPMLRGQTEWGWVQIFSESEPCQVSATGRAYWTDRRRALRQWINSYGPSIAELYEGAVQLLYGPSVPGRVRFVCHAVREIGNRLPDVVAGRQGRGRLDYASYLDKIAK